MAEATYLSGGVARSSPGNVGRSQSLLAACKAKVSLLKSKQWVPILDAKSFRLQLIRNGPRNFILLIVDEEAVKIQEKIILRYNTVFKVIAQNVFTLLDDGVTFWAFEVTGNPSDTQTFTIVMQHSLASLKEFQNKGARLTVAASSQRQEAHGDQQCFLNNICLTLSDSINRGNEQLASDLARQLASQKASVSIKLDEPEKDKLLTSTESNKINVKVQVEDMVSTGCHFRLDVSPQITIQQLKQMVEMKYNFPANIQRWIIGKRLPKPHEILTNCGIKKSGTTLFLYLVSEKNLPGQDHPAEWRNYPPVVHRAHSEPDLPVAVDIIQGRQDNLRSVSEMPHHNTMRSMPLLQSRQQAPVASARTVGWVCEVCTFVNIPTRPGCEMCGTNRPADYQIPQDYLPNERERERIDRERAGEILIQEEEEEKKRREIEERDSNFQRLLSVVDQRLVGNQEEFECSICFDEVKIGEGVVLRECLHNFCRVCLAEHIRNTIEPEVQCPFDNGDFTCHDVITPQEIQELLNEEDFQKYLDRSLVTAESQAPNSFHCRTPNCPGWCIYDDEVNEFECPVCAKKNCLTCKTIHYPINCKEYQDDLKRNASNDEAARKTQEYLEEMLKTKDGMNCPRCGIILVKKDGCDWMKCTMCKTEICWAVRGPRWGPEGPGDTSGGCKCRINNAKCHPQCKNCH